MNSDLLKEIKADRLLLLIALVLAFGVRFNNLGDAALTDAEAGSAMDALIVSQGDTQERSTSIGAQPAYIFLTAALFSIFGSSNFLARFMPALAGGLLVLLPYLLGSSQNLRTLLGQRKIKITVLVLAFAIALDPALVTISREAGGPMLGLSFSMLAVGLWLTRKPVLAGISAGIAVLSGPSVFPGLIVVSTAWFLVRLIFPEERIDPDRDTGEGSPEYATHQGKASDENLRSGLRPFLISMVSAILIVATLFLLFPRGIGAWFNGIPEYLSGWFIPARIPASRIPAALIVYELMAVIFSLVLVIKYFTSAGQRTPGKARLFLFLALWIVLGLSLLMLYPGRLVSDLVWLVLPLWILAAIAIAYLIPGERVTPVAISQAVFILVLSGLFWYTLAATTRSQYGTSQYLSHFAIMGGILALGGLTTVLVAMGWGWKVSSSGLFLGAASALLLYSVSVMWGASNLRQNQATELLSGTPSTDQTELAEKIVGEFSSWNTGFVQYIEITSLVDAPSIRWAFREYPDFNSRSHLANDSMPAVVITAEGSDIPSLNANYRGEDFVWWNSPGWQGGLPPDTARWLTFREAPLVKEKVIFWFRSDLFKDSETEAFDYSDN